MDLGLAAVHARLRRVAVLSRDALEVIRSQDGPDTLFYLIAMKEQRARDVLRHMAGTSQELKDYLSGLRTRLNLVLLAQQEEAAR